MATTPTEQTAIRNVQRYLRQLSYHDKDIPPAPVDGVWDTETRDSLIAFQKKMGLIPTGVADMLTFDTLYAEYQKSVATYSPPSGFDIFPRIPANYRSGMGDSQFLVRVIQYILNELQVAYDDLGEIPQDGEYNEATARAVRQFQLRNELEATGCVDKFTWNKLNTEHNKYNDPSEQ